MGVPRKNQRGSFRGVKALALLLLRFYRAGISPFVPPSCRFYPTCSAYAEEAVQRHGCIRGAWLSVRRLLRCHPFGPHGPDPVPLTGLDREGQRR